MSGGCMGGSLRICGRGTTVFFGAVGNGDFCRGAWKYLRGVAVPAAVDRIFENSRCCFWMRGRTESRREVPQIQGDHRWGMGGGRDRKLWLRQGGVEGDADKARASCACGRRCGRGRPHSGGVLISVARGKLRATNFFRGRAGRFGNDGLGGPPNPARGPRAAFRAGARFGR